MTQDEIELSVQLTNRPFRFRQPHNPVVFIHGPSMMHPQPTLANQKAS